MANEIEIKQLDRRTVERYLARGILSQADWDKHLQQLRDLSDQVETVTIEQPEKKQP